MGNVGKFQDNQDRVSVKRDLSPGKETSQMSHTPRLMWTINSLEFGT